MAKRIDDSALGQHPLHPQCSSLREKVRFFLTTRGERYAIGTSDTGYVLAMLKGKRWSVVLSKVVSGKRDDYACFRPVATFDMNRDGIPEVVLRQSAAAGEVWGDLVVGRTRDGSWKVVAVSPGSASI